MYYHIWSIIYFLNENISNLNYKFIFIFYLFIYFFSDKNNYNNKINLKIIKINFKLFAYTYKFLVSKEKKVFEKWNNFLKLDNLDIFLKSEKLAYLKNA